MGSVRPRARRRALTGRSAGDLTLDSAPDPAVSRALPADVGRPHPPLPSVTGSTLAGATR